MVLLVARLPMVPLAHLAERLHAHVDTATQWIARLQLVAHLRRVRLGRAHRELRALA